MPATTDDANVSAAAATAPWASEILDFWFDEIGEEGWWRPEDSIDLSCRVRFETPWRAMRDQPAESFLGRADEALAATILFDQMPRNMFRGQAEAYATDALALEIARGAVARGYDIQIGGNGRMFFYMPFQHSENLEDQDMSVRLFEGLGDERALGFARDHRAVIARFGRFPHRNAVLGRENRPGEAEAIQEGWAW